MLDESRHHFQVTIDQETGLVSAVAGDEFDNFEIVNVKAEIPTPVKKVNNDDHYDLTSINDSTTIRIEVPVAKVAGWTQFELQDTLPSYLTAEDIKVEFFKGTESIDYTTAEPVSVYETSSTYSDVQFTYEPANNNLIKFVYSGDLGQGLLGKTVVMTFKLRINDLTEYLKAHPRGIVNNIAFLDVGALSAQSNEVTIAAPLQVPQVTKKIDGNETENDWAAKLKTLPLIFASMPDNLDNYKEPIIEDAPATVLDTESPTAEAIKSRINIFVNDLPDDSLKDDLSIKEVNGHKVTYHIPETNVEKIKELEGKTLRLEILASLDAAADFDNSNDTLVFNEDGIYKVKNEASSKFCLKMVPS